MKLNFDQLKTDNPFGLPEAGYHHAVISSAEVKKTKAGKTYISTKFDLVSHPDGKTYKGFEDNHYIESDSDFVEFKWGRFITVLDLNLTGELEANQVVKILPGRKLGVAIRHNEEEYKGTKTMKAQVDVFKNGYFHQEEFAAMIKNTVADSEDEATPDTPESPADGTEFDPNDF